MDSEFTAKMKNLNNLISSLTDEKCRIVRKLNQLEIEKEKLQAEYFLKKSAATDWKDWSRDSHTWSDNVQKVLKNNFNLNEFRLAQLAAINATLSKKDVLLLMPTGGGKSLCYQLPALIDKGMTLVISPLLSLIHDQIIKLKKLNINALKLTSGVKKESKDIAFKYMIENKGEPIKLLYVTPEWLAKSKRFMSALQKCYEMGNLNRFAIDEVHCCSQWGHDFRPDYKYLGLLKGMFPNVPIIGLTATATMTVLQDVQEMIDIPGCVIMRSPFYRSNLNFKIVVKPDKPEDCYILLTNYLSAEFKDQSGIIYTATIKESEQLCNALQEQGLKVRFYHADLDEKAKQEIHDKWLNNKYQAIVATVAFGMGIDKADVRFVIHHSVPKSIESLYQESGRAGRDGKPAQCIVMFRLSDYFRHSGLAKSKTDVKNALNVLEYCLNYETCRHKLIGVHFEEKTDIKCDAMCDNCVNNRLVKFNIKKACCEIYTTIDNATKKQINLTLLKLIDLWFKTYKPTIKKEESECIVGKLLLKGYLKEEKNYTAYSVNCYLRKAFNTVTDDIDVVMTSTGGLKRYASIISEVSRKRTLDNAEPSVSNCKIKK